MKVAIVHDQLQEFGGAERVLVALKHIYPEADVFTSFLDITSLGHHYQKMKNWKIYTSWAQKVPLLNKLYSPLRFITPLLWESFDFSNYNLVISSSGVYMSKGIVTRPETVHICYLHHPPKSLYFYETPIEWQKYLPIKIYGTLINHNLRIYDYLSSQRVDYFVANSEETKKRIEKFYRRDAKVIYPPVSIPESKDIALENEDRSYYLTVSRVARTKHMDVMVQAAKKKGFKLKIVGTGRDEARLKSLADENTEFLGNVKDEELKELFNHAKAFLFAAVDEDFGIAPVEALGYGVPVIAYKSGAIPETIRGGENGYLFTELTPLSLIEKIEEFEKQSEKEKLSQRKKARESSEKYSADEFAKQITTFVNKSVTHI